MLLVAAGCLYHSWTKDSQGGEGEEERCLVGTRRRVRAAVGSLEERLGVALWPCSKREGGGGEDDDNDGEAGGRARDQEVEEKEDSDDSSQEEEKKEEGAPSRLQMEVEKRKEDEEEEEETSSESDDDQSGAAGGGAEKVSLEETVPVTAGPDNQKGTDVFEVTVL